MALRITKKINNNVALAVDSAGKDLVVFGLGIGFPAMPYELTDLSKIQRTFYDIRANYVELAANLPEDMIMLAADIVEMAQVDLDCDLNPNLPFTLADHLNFAMERYMNGIELNTPFAYDAVHFYPAEIGLGRQTLELIKQRKGIVLPDSEAVNIALHLVNGEMENSDMYATLTATEIIRDITEIIESNLNLKLDVTSFNYSRFIMHLRYLLQRIELNTQENNGMGSVIRQFRIQYPDIYWCTQEVCKYLANKCQRQCNDDETLYLFMHINRLKERGAD